MCIVWKRWQWKFLCGLKHKAVWNECHDQPTGLLLRLGKKKDELSTIQNDTGASEFFVIVIFDHVNGWSLQFALQCRIVVFSISCVNTAMAVNKGCFLALYCYLYKSLEFDVILCVVLDGEPYRIRIVYVTTPVLLSSAISNVRCNFTQYLIYIDSLL